MFLTLLEGCRLRRFGLLFISWLFINFFLLVFSLLLSFLLFLSIFLWFVLSFIFNQFTSDLMNLFEGFEKDLGNLMKLHNVINTAATSLFWLIRLYFINVE